MEWNGTDEDDFYEVARLRSLLSAMATAFLDAIVGGILSYS